ncbi:hypothetical protein EK386_15785 [Lysinibacillus antri]|uniref:histidine kinase n=2 Tax=Lysinibacillus antri TaxID=2498145 RepID=A0A432L912_9BACI|nr:hypothetical protein EK386_15785 [Lysinibacillus antri]
MELESLLFLFQDKLYNVKAEMKFSDADRNVVGKRNLLLKTFFNLFKNAIEAIPEKGVTRIENFYKNGWIHIKMSDTGVGISEEKLKMLGTPFFTTKNNRTGLGLTQVYTTIYDHGDDISVQSLIGVGTIFHIQLPAQ